MARLKHSELKALSESLLELYAPVSHADLPARLFAVLRRNFSCNSYCYDEFIDTTAIRMAHTPELRLDTEVFNRYAAQHPSIEAIVRDQVRRSVKISDFKTLSQWQQTDLYNDFFRLEGLNYQLGYLALNEGPRLGMALNRTKRDFSEEERAMFDLLMPHILQVFQTSQLFLSETSEELDPQPLQSLGLTKREAQVLLWISQGKRNSEIAEILGARARTIGKHLEKIFAKLGVETRTAAANMALEVLRPSSLGNGSSH